MPSFTNRLDLYLPGGGSLDIGGADEVADVDKLNQNFQKIDAFADSIGTTATRNQSYYGPAANRTGLTGLKKGDSYQESDGDRRFWQYDGSAWVSAENGMYIIWPSAVTGADVDPTGAITPSADTDLISFNTGSLARYRAVRLLIGAELTVGAIPILRFKRSGTVLQAADSYQNQRSSSNASTPVSAFTASTGINISYASQLSHFVDMTLINPGQASTSKRWLGRGWSGTTNPQDSSFAGNKSDTEGLGVIDGFQLNTVGASMKAGKNSFIRIYGLI